MSWIVFSVFCVSVGHKLVLLSEVVTKIYFRFLCQQKSANFIYDQKWSQTVWMEPVFQHFSWRHFVTFHRVVLHYVRSNWILLTLCFLFFALCNTVDLRIVVTFFMNKSSHSRAVSMRWELTQEWWPSPRSYQRIKRAFYFWLKVLFVRVDLKDEF